jgi:hypothetical protein
MNVRGRFFFGILPVTLSHYLVQSTKAIMKAIEKATIKATFKYRFNKKNTSC